MMPPTTEPAPQARPVATPVNDRASLRAFQIGAAALLFAFAIPLWNLVQLAVNSDIHSHTLLVPFIVAYLWRTTPGPRPFTKQAVSPAARAPSQLVAFATALLGIAGYVGSWLFRRNGRLGEIDAIALSIAAFLLCGFALALATIGWRTLRPRVFALGFALFFIPLPTAAVEGLSVLLQKASAEAADLMISLTGMPQLRDGMVFRLPTLTIQVAEECSGVRSTFVLFMTSLLAGHMFLRAGWKKALLAFAVFPMGVLRNAFRITTLSWLSVNVDSGVIDSALHHRGGPIFFGLSLVPLFALLWLFRRSDLRRSRKVEQSP